MLVPKLLAALVKLATSMASADTATVDPTATGLETRLELKVALLCL